jgi:monovalent cation/proton antiporter MnhG/PhaG subunit
MIGEVLVAAGAVLAAIAALGAVRLDGVLAKMHALTKAATGGITLALVGAAVALWSASSLTTLALALALQLFTFPVGANLVAHAVYVRELARGGLDGSGSDTSEGRRNDGDALGRPEGVD